MLDIDSDSFSKNDKVTAPNQQSKSIESKNDEVNSLFASSKAISRSHVLLATAWITVGSPSGRVVTVRALLDQGSEMTFITEKLAQCLHVKRIRMPVSISAVDCVNAGTYRFAARIHISPRHKSAPVFSTTALILKSLTSYAPKRFPADSTLNHLADLPWVDHDPMSADPIDIIIGADVYSELMLDGIRKGATGNPIAPNLILGWVISGPISSSLISSHFSLAASSHDQALTEVNAHHCFSYPSLESELRKFWEVEEISRQSSLSPEDEKCEEHFRFTHSRCPDGRYMVRLPFREGPPIDIGQSRAIAEKFLSNLIWRLQANPEHAEEYATFLYEYESLGHMREVTALFSSNAQCVFIPHHPVIRDSSATTHLRVVFNASSITSNGSSLNDHLLSGPKLQTELPAVLLQWRQFKYVYTADITKMYRQIRIDPRDANYQKILWKDTPSESTREFQLLTVTYGTASAPFLVLRVLKQLVLDEGHNFPLAIPILKDQIYVDDVLFGGSDVNHLRQTREQLKTLLNRGGFELGK